ncbi:MAG: hypothetical protein HMLIMOIP_001059 [Candidatus Nitrosomirales archaeon]
MLNLRYSEQVIFINNFADYISMSDKRKDASMVELPFLLSRIAFDSSLALLLSVARVAQIANKSVEAGIDKYIELMESEMKTATKEKVDVD